MAADWRAQFKQDVVVDIVGYRRSGYATRTRTSEITCMRVELKLSVNADITWQAIDSWTLTLLMLRAEHSSKDCSQMH